MEAIRRFWKRIVAVAVGLGAIFLVVDYLTKWGVLAWLGALVSALAIWLIANWQPVTTALLALAILYVFYRLYRLEKHAPISFTDNFKSGADLTKTWHYEGKWDISKNGELRVTHSHNGGITRVGQLWTDYEFEFTAVLDEKVIGWIVRAQDMANYYMIQLTPNLVRPHLRYAGQFFVLGETQHDLKIKANKPIRIRTVVRNIEARVYVDDEEIYNNHKLFETKGYTIEQIDDQGKKTGSKVSVVVPAFITGRVGFREDRGERARFSKCRVRPLN